MTALRRSLFGLGLLALLAFAPLARGQDANAVLSRIAFGSCADQDKPLPIFDALAAQKPELLILLGDNIYADLDKSRKVTTEVIKEKYETLAKLPGWQKLKATCPILATWDDHDYGKNDSGVEWALKDDSQKLLLDFFEVPENSPRRKQKGVYHAAIFGPPGKRVQVILLDTRYFRSPLKRAAKPDFGSGSRVPPYIPNNDPDVTMLGAEQWTWLEEQLKKPAEVRLIGSSVQAVHDEHPWEKWANFPAERTKFFNLIRSTQANGVVILSGDRHLAELSMDASLVGYPLYDLTSSGFNQGTKTWRAAEKNSKRIAAMPYGDNLGMVLIDWSKPDPVLTLQIRDVDGDVVIGHKVPLSVLKADSAVATAPGPKAEAIKLPAGVLGAADARGKLGESITVQFAVRGGREVSAGKRILLNSETDFRSEKNFTVVLEINAMSGPYSNAKFATFKGQTIRATGTVKEFNKQLEIVVTDAKDLSIVK